TSPGPPARPAAPQRPDRAPGADLTRRPRFPPEAGALPCLRYHWGQGTGKGRVMRVATCVVCGERLNVLQEKLVTAQWADAPSGRLVEMRSHSVCSARGPQAPAAPRPAPAAGRGPPPAGGTPQPPGKPGSPPAAGPPQPPARPEAPPPAPAGPPPED